MKFSYTALSASNQKAEGVLSADSLEAAKKELHEMGLSIISIEDFSDAAPLPQKTSPSTPPSTDASIATFVFKATDAAGKAVEGTIDAQSDYSAYKRLMTEYHFKVQELYLQGIDPSLIPLALKKFSEFEATLKVEGVQKSDTEKKSGNVESEAAVDPVFVAEIDKIIESAKSITEHYKTFFTSTRLHEVETVLSELIRIRTSNNIRHITQVGDRLFDLLAEPDNPDYARLDHGQYDQLIAALKKDSDRSDLSRYKKAIGITQLQSIFNRFKKLKWFQKNNTTSPPSVSRPLGLGQRFTRGITALKMRFLKPGSVVAPPTPALAPQNNDSVAAKDGREFTEFFIEADSFVGWLLFFYIAYFFLAGFSLEKHLGISTGFVLKTFQSPLIFNIALFLFLTHFLLRLKIRSFAGNFMGSLFLFFFGYGLLALVLLNF